MAQNSEVITLKNLLEEISETTGVSKAKAEEIIKTFLEKVTDNLIEGYKVKVLSFGTFKINRSEAREGIKPATGEPIWIEAKNSVKFAAAKQLKDKVNN